MSILFSDRYIGAEGLKTVLRADSAIFNVKFNFICFTKADDLLRLLVVEFFVSDERRYLFAVVCSSKNYFSSKRNRI